MPTGESFQRTLRQGAELFNVGMYWHCHEFLEQAWLPAEGERRILLQAIIQAASAFNKWLYEENAPGAVKHLDHALENLSKLPPDFFGLALDEFRAGLEACRQALFRGETESIARLPVPRLRKARRRVYPKSVGGQ